MENYDAYWAKLLQGLPPDVMLDHYEELDNLAKDYQKELDELIRLKTLQDPSFNLRNRTFGSNIKSPYDEKIDKLNKNTLVKRNAIISKSLEKTEDEISAEKPEKITKEELAKQAAENRKEVTEKKTLTTEEKFAQEKENAWDITGVRSDGNGGNNNEKEPTNTPPEPNPEPQSPKQQFKDQKDDLEDEREKFRREIEDAMKRSQTLERER